MLAEGDSNTRTAIDRQNDAPPSLNKTQIKCLQEAMYHSAENNHLGWLLQILKRLVRLKFRFKFFFLLQTLLSSYVLSV